MDLIDSKLPESYEHYEKKYVNNFENWATFLGNGVYQWRGIYHSDTRILFLIGILKCEGIDPETFQDPEQTLDVEMNPPYIHYSKRK